MKTMIYVGNSREGGISLFELNRTNGTLVGRGGWFAEKGVTPLVISHDRRFLYAAVRGEPISLASFAIDAASGELHFLNAVTIADLPAYLAIDSGGRFLLSASYHGGTVGVWALGREGMIQPEPVCLQRPGRNPHCIVLDAADRFAYVPVLGNDAVAVFDFDPRFGALTPATPPLIAAPRESGPRHIILSPDNRYAYLLTELSGEIVKYSVCRSSGALVENHAVRLLPADRALPPGRYVPPLNHTGSNDGPNPDMWAADIRITPDSRFLYASERAGSTLSCYTVDPVSGRLDATQVIDTEKQPRGFAVDPFGRFLFVAGEKSNHLAAYALDKESGVPSLADRRESGGVAPNWLEVVVLP